MIALAPDHQPSLRHRSAHLARSQARDARQDKPDRGRARPPDRPQRVDEVKSNYAGRYRLLALVTAGSSSAAEAYAIQLVHTSSNPPSVSAQMPRPRIASE